MTGATEPVEQISGTYAGRGVTCPQFKMDTGETVSLSGVTERDMVDYADIKLTLGGAWWKVSTCMQGRDFHVKNISVSD